MDWDLWGPMDDIVFEGPTPPEWQFDYRFAAGADVFGEDAEDEKASVQVLRFMLSKADDDIEELERELLYVKSEFTWFESEEWCEICGNVLGEKIDSLEFLISTMKEKDANDIEVLLLMPLRPFETLYQVLNTLLASYQPNINNKNDDQIEQPNAVKDAVALDSRLDGPPQSTISLDENKTLSTGASEIVGSEEIKESSTATTENSANYNPIPVLQLQEETVFNPKPVKCVNINVKDSSMDSFELLAGRLDEKKISSNSSSKITENGEAMERVSMSEENRMIQTSSSESADKGALIPEAITPQPANSGMSNSMIDDSKNTCGHSDDDEKLSDVGSGIMNDEAEVHGSICRADIAMSASSSMQAANVTDSGKKPANSPPQDLGMDARRCLTGESGEMKKLSKSVSQTNISEELGPSSRATGKSKISSCVENLEGKGSYLGSDKPADAIVKNVPAEEFRCATGFKEKSIENSSSRLVTFKSQKSRNPDMEQKLCDIAREATRKKIVKESKVWAAANVKWSNSSPKTDRKQRHPPQEVEVREAALNDTENSTLTFLLELEEQKDGEIVKFCLTKKEEPVQEVQIAGNAYNETKSGLNIQNEDAHRTIESSKPILKEVDVSSMELASCSISVSEGTKQVNSGVGLESAGLNQSENGKTTRKLVKHPKVERHDADNGDSIDSVSLPQKKKRKTRNISSSIKLKDSVVPADLSMTYRKSQNASKDYFSQTEAGSVSDSSHGAVLSLPVPAKLLGPEMVTLSLDTAKLRNSDSSELLKLKVNQLLGIAKHLKLTKYSKLRKDVLIKKIVDHFSNQ